LRVHGRVAVDLAGRRLEEAGALGHGELDQVLRAAASHVEDLDRHDIEVGGRRRAGQVHHRVDRSVHVQPFDHILADKGEPGAPDQLLEVALGARDQVVDRDDLVAALEQSQAQVGAEEPGPAGHHDPPPAQLRPMPS